MADRPDHDLADRLPTTCPTCGSENPTTFYGSCFDNQHDTIFDPSLPLDPWHTYMRELGRLLNTVDNLNTYVAVGREMLERAGAERDDLRRQLDALRSEAKGLDWWTGGLADIPETLKIRLARVVDALAAVGDPEPTNPDEPHPDADFIEVDYWCHFDDKGRAVRVHDASTVHMDGCTRMYVRAVGDPEEGR